MLRRLIRLLRNPGALRHATPCSWGGGAPAGVQPPVPDPLAPLGRDERAVLVDVISLDLGAGPTPVRVYETQPASAESDA